MPARFLGDGVPQGQPTSKKCPECGGVVYKRPIPSATHLPRGNMFQCKDCGRSWEQHTEPAPAE